MKTCATCRHQDGIDRRRCLYCHRASEYRPTRAETRARVYVVIMALAIIAAVLWAGMMDYHDLVRGALTP